MNRTVDAEIAQDYRHQAAVLKAHAKALCVTNYFAYLGDGQYELISAKKKFDDYYREILVLMGSCLLSADAFDVASAKAAPAKKQTRARKIGRGKIH